MNTDIRDPLGQTPRAARRGLSIHGTRAVTKRTDAQLLTRPWRLTASVSAWLVARQNSTTMGGKPHDRYAGVIGFG